MKYAIAHDCGSDGWSFVTESYETIERKLFDSFGEAYQYAIGLGNGFRFEVFGVFEPDDIKVDVTLTDK